MFTNVKVLNGGCGWDQDVCTTRARRQVHVFNQAVSTGQHRYHCIEVGTRNILCTNGETVAARGSTGDGSTRRIRDPRGG